MINIPFLKRKDVIKMSEIFRIKELEKYVEIVAEWNRQYAKTGSFSAFLSFILDKAKNP